MIQYFICSVPKISAPVSTAPSMNTAFQLQPTQPSPFVPPPSTFQPMPMWQPQRPVAVSQYNPVGVSFNGNPSMDQFQALLPATTSSSSSHHHLSNSNIQTKTPLLQPMNNSRSSATATSQGSNILTKEDILEFLK